MPDDFVLNVRQLAGFPLTEAAVSSDTILIQRGGLGGPYLSITAQDLVATALEGGGVMGILDRLDAAAIRVRDLQATGAASTMGIANVGGIGTDRLDATDWIRLNGVDVATQDDLADLGESIINSTVWSVNGRRGDIVLSLWDVPGAAPLFSPRFGGSPRGPTAPWCDSSSWLATTAWVQRHVVTSLTCLLRDHPFVFTFNGRTGDVKLTAQDIADAGDVFNDTQFTGTPTAPTAPAGTDTAQLATTAFVQDAIANSTVWAPLESPSFTGTPTALTAAPGTTTAQLATCAFVMNAVTESTTGVASFNGRTGAVVLDEADVSAVGVALLNSPAFTGQPTAPTASPGNNSSQLATCAFVSAAIAAAEGVASFNSRTGAIILTSADLSAAGGALLASPAFTGTPSGPTAAAGTSTTQLATTQFVASAVAGTVLSFNGRTGAVALTVNDISAAGGLTNPNAALTGVPTAPTAAQGVNSTQIATTAFVVAAMAAGGGVDSFNGRAGNVTLTSADITSAGGALASALANYLPLAGGTLTGPLAAGGGIVGVTDGSNAAPGQVGEYISNVRASAAALAMTAATNYVIASISLTAGDWQVEGAFAVNIAAGGGVIGQQVASVTTGTTQIGAGLIGQTNFMVWSATATGILANNTVHTGSARFNLTATTTVNLVCQVGAPQGGPTVTGFGWIAARRVR